MFDTTAKWSTLRTKGQYSYPILVTPYVSPLRQEQAEATRRRVIAAAAECFAEQGYTTTTLRVIARRAGVSVETVQTAGPKRSLLVAAFNQLFTGEAEEREFAERPAVAEIMGLDDGVHVLRRLAQWLAASNARVADLWQVLVASASDDPEVASYMHELHQRTREQAGRVVSDLVRRGLIRPSRSVSRTADLIWDAQSPERYLRLVRHAGWSQTAYADALAENYLNICRPNPDPA